MITSLFWFVVCACAWRCFCVRGMLPFLVPLFGVSPPRPLAFLFLVLAFFASPP